MTRRCSRCGAPLGSLICGYCGMMHSPDAYEQRAADEENRRDIWWERVTWLFTAPEVKRV